VVVLRRDPLADPTPTPWPLVDAGALSLWQPIPVGTDEDGNQVTVTLPERNLLLGGEPGAGKSNVLQLLVAVGALDPSVRLTLFDPKLVELAVWQGSAARLVGPNVEEAIEVLKQLIGELDDRYLTLLANRARKVTEGDGLPLHLVGIEELAYFTNGPDRKAAQAFSTLLRDFVARGRAAGMVTVATTQKPSADVVPTFLRDLFGVPLGAALLHPPGIRHHPRFRLGVGGLLGRQRRPGRPRRRAAVAGGRGAGAAAVVLAGRPGPGQPGPSGRGAAGHDQDGGADAALAGRHRMTEPVLVGDVLPGVVAEAIARAGPGYDRWAEQVAATGYCVHPVRLRGRVDHAEPQTGEVRTVYSTDRSRTPPS
jgi:hypothetical protein